MPNPLKQLRRKLFGLDEQEAALHRAISDTNDLIAQLQRSFDHLHRDYSRALVEIVAQNQPKNLLSCVINDCPLKVPVEILRSYAHCLETSQEISFSYRIETHCVEWLAQFLQPGDTFLDVGAAYGVISLPLAQIVGDRGKIYAFEPAKKTRHLLEYLLHSNHLKNITVVPKAISDQPGEAEFVEYSTDNQFAWAADTSALASEIPPSQENYQTYAVEVTTLDEFVKSYNLSPQAIKIDIEGFEQYALEGAKHCLQSYHPALCIDIHQDVKTKESALLTVEPFLKALGYQCEYREHTLFAKFTA